MSKKKSQREFIFSYFKERPNQDIPTHEAVDWATREWRKLKKRPLRDPDRQIRKLAELGWLVKAAKGLYRYDPAAFENRELEEFTPAQKQAIIERDDGRCVVCGMGEAEGFEIQVDHIKSRERGGKATIPNGQVLCAAHNYRKKHYGQTETGKRMFIRLHHLALQEGDQPIVAFCEEILAVYDKHEINGHIEWDPK